MTAIGFVGAGAGTAAAAFAVDSALEGAEVTVLEKSGGLCGRAATRRHGPVTYDYGANYVKSEDERVAELLTETLDTDGLVDVDEPIYTFDSDGTVREGRDGDDHKWTYERGLTQIAKRLFDRTDATVHRNTKVTGLGRDGAGWHLTDADGDEWGPFDALVCNPPAPQSVDLLATADWDDSLRVDLVAALETVGYRTVITAILHYPFRIARPYYALVNPDTDHDIGWIAREECKRGHVPDGETLLVVQANHEWSVAHYDEATEVSVARLAESTASVLADERLGTPDWTDYQGWRYALPEVAAPSGLLQQAEAQDLYFVGDWTVGEPRLHAALRSGLDTAERLCLSW